MSDEVKDLVKKWNLICRTINHGKASGFLLNLSSPSSFSTSSNERAKRKLHKSLPDWSLIFNKPCPATKEDQILLHANQAKRNLSFHQTLIQVLTLLPQVKQAKSLDSPTTSRVLVQTTATFFPVYWKGKHCGRRRSFRILSPQSLHAGQEW